MNTYPKNDKDKIYSKMTKYIHAENIQCILLISGKKWCHPNGNKHEFEVAKKRVGYMGDTKDSKKYGCVCIGCHIYNLPLYKCVIFLRNNYNFNIPAVANALSKRHREIRWNSYANHVINNWKMANTATMSKIVIILICLGQI